MPAKNLIRIDEEGIYSHIYNKGVEKRIIFNDEEDYRVFQDFLEDYLAAPKDPASIKKVFKVHGRIFQGTPHQPKNYFNEVELIAYSLMPDHFHLLLRQITRGYLEKFIRSLCTRYSIYFNKKYQRTGALFEGPYKSVMVKELHLPNLSRFLHLDTDGYSSYPEYLGSRETSWVKPEVVLSLFDRTGGYKDFVEKYELDQKEKELIKSITFESDTNHLERRLLASNEQTQDSDLKLRSTMPELLVISAALFILLVTIGIGNIKLSAAKISQSLQIPTPIESGPTPEVLSETEEGNTVPTDAVTTPPAETVKSEEIEEATSGATPEIIPKTIVIVKVDKSLIVNIRQEPSTNSKIIGQAKDGDTFEFVSLNSGWYEIKLADGSNGFISETVSVMEEVNN